MVISWSFIAPKFGILLVSPQTAPRLCQPWLPQARLTQPWHELISAGKRLNEYLFVILPPSTSFVRLFNYRSASKTTLPPTIVYTTSAF